MTDTPPKLSLTQMGAGIFVLLAGPSVGSLLGSFTGDAGTVWGAAIGSVVLPGLLAWLFLRATYHARNHLAKVPWRKAKPWHYAAAVPVVAAVVFAVSMGGLSAVEAKVLHRSLSAEVTHTRGSGTTFGTVLDNAPRPSPSATEPPVTVSPSPSGSVVVPVPSLPATATPSPSASPSVYVPPPASTDPSGAASPAATQTQQQGVTP